MHLYPCGIYECNRCYVRKKRLADSTEHIKTEHEKDKVEGTMA
jgi:hypothetical protein